MAEQNLQLYEAMFLVETNIASDWEAAKGMIQKTMDRANAQLLVRRLWDERRLAYPISKHKRATYILCYFRAHGSAIGGIERDVQLSEYLLRVLVLRADHVTDEELEKIKALPERREQPAQVHSDASDAARRTYIRRPAREEAESVADFDKDKSTNNDIAEQSGDVGATGGAKQSGDVDATGGDDQP